MLFLDIPTRRQLAKFAHKRCFGIASTARSHGPDWMERNLPGVFDRLVAQGAPITQGVLDPRFLTRNRVHRQGAGHRRGALRKWIPLFHGRAGALPLAGLRADATLDAQRARGRRNHQHGHDHAGTGLETYVSKEPITSVDDLKGIKVRAPKDMVQDVFAAAGMSPVNMPFSEVFTARDKGVTDAADTSQFSTQRASDPFSRQAWQ